MSLFDFLVDVGAKVLGSNPADDLKKYLEEDGDNILGHILGTKEMSRRVAG